MGAMQKDRKGFEGLKDLQTNYILDTMKVFV